MISPKLRNGAVLLVQQRANDSAYGL
jgi:hypothetical protein